MILNTIFPIRNGNSIERIFLHIAAMASRMLAFKCSIVFRKYLNGVKSHHFGGQLTTAFRLIKRPSNV